MNRKNGFEVCEKINVFSAGISRFLLPSLLFARNKQSTSEGYLYLNIPSIMNYNIASCNKQIVNINKNASFHSVINEAVCFSSFKKNE